MNTSIFVLLLCTFRVSASYAQLANGLLVINEILASNANDQPGELWLFGDWLEIYNTGGESVDMGGMYFSDDFENPLKWKIVEGQAEKTTISPKGHLLFWFDGFTYLNALHVGFKLNGNGESVILTDKDGVTVLDSFTFKKQYTDVSYGRLTDGSEKFSLFENPTPGKANVGTTAILEILSQPVFSVMTGFYNQPINISITADKKATIYYTMDGSDPNPDNGNMYQGSIEVDSTFVLKSIAYRKGIVPSKVAVSTYIMHENFDLPVVSLTVDPKKMYEKRTGLYISHFSEIERGGYVEYFDTAGQLGFSMNIGVKLTGRYSKEFPKKSFMLVNRSKYGKKEIEYPLFAHLGRTKFDGFILRSDPTASKSESPKLSGERIKNELIYKINVAMGELVDMQAYEPAILFVNGEYWGLYNIMERKAAKFIEAHYGYKDIDMINGKDVEVIVGDELHFEALLEYLDDSDLTNEVVFDSVKAMIDVSNFVDYWIQEFYYASDDPSYNVRFWRPRIPKGRWRWINFDHDSWETYADTGLYYYSRGTDEGDILGQLLVNTTFRNYFINRFADCLNTMLRSEVIKGYVDDITAVIESQKIRDRQRWEPEMNFKPLGSQISWVKEFAVLRPSYLKKQLMERFSLDGEWQLTVNVNSLEKGSVRINTIFTDNLLWEGIYFNGVPVTVEAVPNLGYSFEGWGGDENKKSSILILNPSKDMNISATFK